jgi:hypothetical protein
MSQKPISPLRQRMLEDMNMRRLDRRFHRISANDKQMVSARGSACWPAARACFGAERSGLPLAPPIKARAGRKGKSSNGTSRQGSATADRGC